MIIKDLELVNHRNYSHEVINFHENTNILIGKNAQGKTNLLEAIYICARGSSFKSLKEDKIIKFGQKASYLRADILIKDRKRRVEVKLTSDEAKKIRINEIEIESIQEMKSQFGVVLFSPEELKIIKETPSIRRKFIDDLISNNDISYRHLLNNFNKVRLQKNQLLKSSKQTRYFDQMLEASNQQLVNYGAKLAIYRARYIQILQAFAKEFHKVLSSDKEELTLTYENNFSQSFDDLETIEKNYQELLEENKQREKDQYVSLIGPHKDDLRILINELDSRTYASQGQQRTAMLSLKLAEAKLIEELTTVKPILLLDDVFSELDNQRARLLVEAIKGHQTIITSNQLNNLDTRQMYGNIYKIQAGKVYRLPEKG